MASRNTDSVTADSRRYGTKKMQITDPSIASENDQPIENRDYRNLTYLAGAVSTCDVGVDGRYVMAIAMGAEWEADFKRASALRRHTVESGSSTFTREEFR